MKITNETPDQIQAIIDGYEKQLSDKDTEIEMLNEVIAKANTGVKETPGAPAAGVVGSVIEFRNKKIDGIAAVSVCQLTKLFILLNSPQLMKASC